VVPAWQVPLPLQVPALVKVPFVQLAGEQMVPAITGPQVPLARPVRALLHAWQAPVQAASQQ
jgi:hypothetical protein